MSTLKDSLTYLKLPTIRRECEAVAEIATKENYSYDDYLSELVDREVSDRKARRLQKDLRASRLPLEKSLKTLQHDRFSPGIISQIKSLAQGHFLKLNENVIVIGRPGSGKTHLVCAIAQAQIQKGASIFFTTAALLIQDLLAAKAALRLPKFLKSLKRFDAIVVDDIGYVQYQREEMEVFFVFLAEQYEKKSLLITSNLAFSKWDKIFKDQMTTSAAVDRLVHHALIIELNLPSFRLENAKNNKKKSVKK